MSIRAHIRLPGEITDTIIDHLHDDPSTLRTCSIVCRTWTAASHNHLFHRLNSSPERFGLNDLISFLVTHPDVSLHIKHFRLSGYRGVSLRDLATILESLPSLRILELNDMYISPPLSSEEPIFCVVDKLVRLWISHINIIDRDHDLLLRVLGLFTRIISLQLSPFLLPPQHDDRPHFSPLSTRLPSHVRIDSLTTDMMSPLIIARLIHSAPLSQWHSLRELHLVSTGCNWAQVADLGSLMAEIGPRLRVLSVSPNIALLRVPNDADAQPGLGLDPIVSRDTTEDWKALRLDLCTSLEIFITGATYAAPPIYNTQASFRLWVDLLPHLPQSVREIQVNVRPLINYDLNGPLPQSSDPLKALEWAHLDRIMSARRFQDAVVVLQVRSLQTAHPGEGFTDVVTFLKNELRELDASGKLVFDLLTRKW